MCSLQRIMFRRNFVLVPMDTKTFCGWKKIFGAESYNIGQNGRNKKVALLAEGYPWM